MRIADEVVSRLKNGEGPDTVRASYRSQSQVFEGFRLYIDEQEKKIREIRFNLFNSEEELKQTNNMRDLAQREKKDLTKDVDVLRSENTRLQKDVDDKRAELEALRKAVEALQKRGF